MFRNGLRRSAKLITKSNVFLSKWNMYQRLLPVVVSNAFTTSSKRCSRVTKKFDQSLDISEEVERFSSQLPIEEAVTPPSSWFICPEFYTLEKEAVFKRNWIAVGRVDQVQQPGQYFAGSIGDEPFIVVRDNDHKLQAFFNVCRHHASRLVRSGEGNCEKFTCPYHGWTYLLNGRLAKATRLKGIKNFNARNFGLVPIRVQTLGPLIFVHLGKDEPPDLEKQFQVATNSIDQAGFYNGLTFVKRVFFHVNCNWKVFVDNYLDGGYHVPILHKDLTGNLDMTSYQIDATDSYSVQTCNGVGNDRLGSSAYYAFMYPNFMINRYGPWMDTNLVLPVGHDKCEVVYDYFLEDTKLNSMSTEQRQQYISSSLNDSKQVQDEDQWICENVQEGLKSSGYNVGRYAPHVEMADHRFHQRLAREFREYLGI